MSFPRYPKYKDSGVEWLGEVPEHWGVASLKRGYRVTLGKMLQSEASGPDDELIPYLRAANIRWEGVDLSDVKQMWFSAADKKQLSLREGDLLVSEGGDVGRSCVWAAEIAHCGFQNSVNRIRAIGGYSTHYLCYWMSALKTKGYVDVLCNKSTIAHFTAEKVSSVPVPFPSIPEQSAIAAFLDRETAKIDALIAEQQRLIELLQEKRQAVISHAVTKGLNPAVPMKDSGIEWLGQVPAHWEVETLSRVTTKIGNGFVGPTRDILVESGVPYVQATHIKEGRVNFDGAYFVTQEWRQRHSRAALERGDVLIVQTGAGTGDIGLVSEQEVGYCCHALIIVRAVAEKMLGPFMALTLQSQYGKQTLESIQTGGMHPHLNCGNVKFVYVPIPPLEEQQYIANHVTERLQVFARLQAEACVAISLLQERRSALISAAVTGQIDVRGLARSEAA